MIKAVLYDLGDIFFNAHRWRKFVYSHLKKVGNYWKNFLEFNQYYEGFLVDVYTNNISYEEGFKQFLKSLGIEDTNKYYNLFFQKKAEIEQKHSLYPGVYSTLKKLSNMGILNIVITDASFSGNKIHNNFLKKFRIDKFIKEVISSYDVGFTKPSSEIFNYALKKYNLKKDEVIFVGHDKDEVEGAKNIGLQTVLFNNFLHDNIDSDYEIQRFSELLNIVKII